MKKLFKKLLVTTLLSVLMLSSVGTAFASVDQAVGLPDLVVENLHYSINEGRHSLTLDFDITNIGNESISTFYPIAIYVDGQAYGHSGYFERYEYTSINQEPGIIPINPGDSFHKTYWGIPYGTNKVTVIADKYDDDIESIPGLGDLEDNMIAESNEFNNKTTIDIIGLNPGDNEVLPPFNVKIEQVNSKRDTWDLSWHNHNADKFKVYRSVNNNSFISYKTIINKNIKIDVSGNIDSCYYVTGWRNNEESKASEKVCIKNDTNEILPDLVVKNLKYRRNENNSVSVDFDIANIGNTPVKDWFGIAIYVDGEPYSHTAYSEQKQYRAYNDSDGVVPLEPNSVLKKSIGSFYPQKSITIVVDRIDKTGQRYIDGNTGPIIRMLRDNMIKESNEDNNKSTVYLSELTSYYNENLDFKILHSSNARIKEFKDTSTNVLGQGFTLFSEGVFHFTQNKFGGTFEKNGQNKIIDGVKFYGSDFANLDTVSKIGKGYFGKYNGMKYVFSTLGDNINTLDEILDTLKFGNGNLIEKQCAKFKYINANHWVCPYAMKLSNSGIISNMIKPNEKIDRALSVKYLVAGYEMMYGEIEDTSDHEFNDVSVNNNKAYYILQKALSAGIIAPNLNFYADNLITRAQVAKILTTTFFQEEIEELNGDYQIFDDVSSKHWAAPYISVMKKEGLINGYGDGSFRPDNNVSYSEIIKMLVNTMEHVDEDVFGDDDIYEEI